mgnify:CR=1 FL=1
MTRTPTTSVTAIAIAARMRPRSNERHRAHTDGATEPSGESTEEDEREHRYGDAEEERHERTGIATGLRQCSDDDVEERADEDEELADEARQPRQPARGEDEEPEGDRIERHHPTVRHPEDQRESPERARARDGRRLGRARSHVERP